jgi:ABC-type uncharacterized transport system substrate-binding protein
VIDTGDRAERGLFDALAAAYRSRASVSLRVLDEAAIANPIAKGKLLADLENNDLVVAVGDGATEFAVRELEDVPVYFVDATIVAGSRLASSSVAGLFSYSIDGLLDAVKALRLGAVGVAYTPGYEPVAEWIRIGAASRGLEIVEKKISAPKDIAPAVRGLLERTRAIWVVGDPLLMRGAGFEFIRERTLSLNVPVIGGGEVDVRRGSLLGYRAVLADQAAAAEKAIDRLLRRGLAEPRLNPAPPGGTLLLNATLAGKWKIEPTGDLRWNKLR